MTFDWQANFYKIGGLLPMSDRGVVEAGDEDLAAEIIEQQMVEKHGSLEAFNVIYLASREDLT